MRWVAVALVALLLQQPSHAQDDALTIVADGLIEPVHITHDGTGNDLLYITERAGRVLMYDLVADDYIRDGLGQPKAFLDIRGIAGSWFNEMGLLSIAFHPEYASNGYVFASYVDQAMHSHVVRYERSPEDPYAVQLLGTPVIDVQQPFPNHNGGLVTFGPDGYLYVGLGDGGLANDPLDTGLNPRDLYGSILRLDVDVPAGYAVPSDNPFADGVDGAPEVWAYGLRNPWRFSFDGDDLWVADVGQNLWEEVNHAPGNPAGINYGWKEWEGNHPFGSSIHDPPADPTFPVTEYHHSEGCSITGGFVATKGPAMGKYLFGDYCSQSIWTYTASEGRQVHIANSGADISSFGVGPDGHVYVAALGIQSNPPGGWIARVS